MIFRKLDAQPLFINVILFCVLVLLFFDVHYTLWSAHLFFLMLAVRNELLLFFVLMER